MKNDWQSGLSARAVVLAALTLGLLVANVERPRYCGAFRYRENLSTDSPGWLDAASGFPRSTVESIWCSRPVYPALVKLGSLPFRWLGFSKYNDVRYSALYLGALLVNGLSLWAAAVLLYWAVLTVPGGDDRTGLGAAVLFLSAVVPLTWSNQPLPQVLDYLAVAYGFWFAARLSHPITVGRVGHALFAVAGLGFGLAMLIKPFGFLVLLVLAALLLARRWVELLPMVAGMAAPYLIWLGVVRLYFRAPYYDHSYHSHFAQGRWVQDALAGGDWDRVIEHTVRSPASLWASMESALTPVGAVAVVVALVLGPRLPCLTNRPLMLVYLGSLCLMAVNTQNYFPPRFGFYAYPLAALPVAWAVSQSTSLAFRQVQAQRASLLAVYAVYVAWCNWVMPSQAQG